MYIYLYVLIYSTCIYLNVYYACIYIGDCIDGSVRLVDGANDYEGRVEVCIFEQWGSICDTMWYTQQAEVVCRQLGLPELGKYEILTLLTHCFTLSHALLGY